MTPEHSLIDLAENPLDRLEIIHSINLDFDGQESYGKSEEAAGD